MQKISIPNQIRIGILKEEHKRQSTEWLQLFNYVANNCVVPIVLQSDLESISFDILLLSSERSAESEIFQRFCQEMAEFHAHQMHILATQSFSPSKENENE